MTWLPILILVLVVLAAIAFAVVPIWRAKLLKGRFVLIAAVAVFLLAIGGGTYWMLGQPYLAWRQAEGVNTRDLNGLIALLIKRERQAPNDLQAWVYLGRAYMGAGDANDAAKAYAHAVALAAHQGRANAGLYSLYGEALVAAANGQVSDEAEKAFRAALTLDPKEPASRFFLGDALAARGDKKGAIALWNSLLADIKPNAPLHQTLVDRIALASAGAGRAPDPKAMVAMLANRLKAKPNDPGGWQRLIRAYSVLGERAQAQQALETARKTFAGRKDVLAGFDGEAKALKLD